MSREPRPEVVKVYALVTDTLLPRTATRDALLLVEVEAQLATKLDGTTIQVEGRTVEGRISKAMALAGIDCCPGDRVGILVNPDREVKRVFPVIWREVGHTTPDAWQRG